MHTIFIHLSEIEIQRFFVTCDVDFDIDEAIAEVQQLVSRHEQMWQIKERWLFKWLLCQKISKKCIPVCRRVTAVKQTSSNLLVYRKIDEANMSYGSN